jgi:hypothetical protein
VAAPAAAMAWVTVRAPAPGIPLLLAAVAWRRTAPTLVAVGLLGIVGRQPHRRLKPQHPERGHSGTRHRRAPVLTTSAPGLRAAGKPANQQAMTAGFAPRR